MRLKNVEFDLPLAKHPVAALVTSGDHPVSCRHAVLHVVNSPRPQRIALRPEIWSRRDNLASAVGMANREDHRDDGAVALPQQVRLVHSFLFEDRGHVVGLLLEREPLFARITLAVSSG